MDGPHCRGASRAAPMEVAISVLAAILLVLSRTAKAEAPPAEVADPPVYVGPMPCPSDGSVLGYTNTTILTFDMLSLLSDLATRADSSGEGRERSFSDRTFVLCPHTVFDMGTDLTESDPPLMLPIIPLLRGAVFRCGADGDPNDKCVLRGGFHHALFEDDLAALDGVVFMGLTFEDSLSISVVAWGHPRSEVGFVDCVWKNNIGLSAVDLFWHRDLKFGPEPGNRQRRKALKDSIHGLEGFEGLRAAIRATLVRIQDGRVSEYSMLDESPHMVSTAGKVDHYGDMFGRRRLKYPAMFAAFVGCTFVDNSVDVAIIFNQGGHVDLGNCDFISNQAVVIVINTDNAILGLHDGNHFSQNQDIYGPIFFDSSSSLYLNEDTSGQNNTLSESTVKMSDECDSIFFERSGDCLKMYQCVGECCPFGDSSCASPAALEEASRIRTTSGPSPVACDAGCVVLSLLIPFCVATTAGLGFIFLRKSQRPWGGRGQNEIEGREDDATVADSTIDDGESVRDPSMQPI
uniref:Uncharacterized protein n=1 Tax=Trieres chinensis TaxID=1514140 RepID=A0A7S1ZVD3_TRICV